MGAEENRGFRVRVTYPIIQEYRYAVYPNKRDWRVADRPKGTVFPTQAEAETAAGVISANSDVKAVGGTATVEPISNFDPDWCVPPGVHIKEQMQALGFTAEDMSKALGLTPTLFQQLLDGGDVLIGSHLADRLAIVTSTSAQYWLNLETRYREGLRMGLTVTK